jgi:hypothetical protein
MNESFEFNSEKACRKLNLELSDIEHNNYGYSYAIQIMHYYRFKDMYDICVNNKKYNRKYSFKYYDYETVFKNGFNRFEMGFVIQNMRNEKNNMLNIFVSNYHFYRHDKNMNMFYASVNLLKRIYDYILFFEKEESETEFNSNFENNRLNDMIYAFNLYYTMLNKEKFLSDRDMNNLLNEYFPQENIHKFEFSKINFDSNDIYFK